jgi:hypothetical protein
MWWDSWLLTILGSDNIIHPLSNRVIKSVVLRLPNVKGKFVYFQPDTAISYIYNDLSGSYEAHRLAIRGFFRFMFLNCKTNVVVFQQATSCFKGWRPFVLPHIYNFSKNTNRGKSHRLVTQFNEGGQLEWLLPTTLERVSFWSHCLPILDIHKILKGVSLGELCYRFSWRSILHRSTRSGYSTYNLKKRGCWTPSRESYLNYNRFYRVTTPAEFKSPLNSPYRYWLTSWF